MSNISRRHDRYIVIDGGPVDPPPPPVTITGYLSLHKAAGGYQATPPGMPCVLPSANALPIEFDRDKQIQSWELMDAANDVITRNKWAVVYKHDVAFTNFNGFGDPDDPRADHVNNENLGYPNPKLMKAIICAGSFTTGTPGYSLAQTLRSFTGILGDIVRRPRGLLPALPHRLRALVANNVLICRPGVDGIDSNAGVPPLAEIIEKHWFFYAVTLGWNDPGVISHFPQGTDEDLGYYGPVVIPRFLRHDTVYPLEWFIPWSAPDYPDPLKIYLP